MAKKAYEKPEIKKVELKPEEAVLTACKNSHANGPRANHCNPPGPGTCRIIGS